MRLHLICSAWLAIGAAAILGAPLPPQPTSKKEAVARAQLNTSPAGLSGVRYDLPAAQAGAGPHDFYNLFVDSPLDGGEAKYGICLATDRKELAAGADAAVSSPAADHAGGHLNLKRPLLLTAMRTKIQIVEGQFDRKFVEQAAESGGRVFSISASRNLFQFKVPGWMFAALVEVADKHDYKRRTEIAKDKAKTSTRERRKLYVEAHPDALDRIKEAISGGTLVLGMSADEARASWGKPERVNRTVTMHGTQEQWVYGNTFVYFDDGILTSWQESR